MAEDKTKTKEPAAGAEGDAAKASGGSKKKMMVIGGILAADVLLLALPPELRQFDWKCSFVLKPHSARKPSIDQD